MDYDLAVPKFVDHVKDLKGLLRSTRGTDARPGWWPEGAKPRPGNVEGRMCPEPTGYGSNAGRIWGDVAGRAAFGGMWRAVSRGTAFLVQTESRTLPATELSRTSGGTHKMAHAQLPRQRRAATRDKEFATLCHDLRQCVSAGLLLTQLPDSDRVDRETQRRFDLIQQTLSHAAELLESATTDLAPRQWVMDLSTVAQECVSVAEFGHKVRFVSDASYRPLVYGDPVLVHRAVDNMIDNAGRAAGESGDVVVQVGAAADEAWVEVVDDGPGFGEIEHGTGQGLSVVSTTARANGGRLEISSGPGPGTTVRLVFPRHAQGTGSALEVG